MDREIAAGFYDYKMIDFDFQFRNFTENIPPNEASLLTDRTSNIDSTMLKTSNSNNENNLDADWPESIMKASAYKGHSLSDHVI